MSSIWSFPTRVIFGAGVVADVGREAQALGATSALLITDRGVRDAGLVKPVCDALDAAGIAQHVVTEISSNPREAEVLAAAEAYRTAKADLVVGVGGGSPLDVAKLVRLAVTHPGPLSRYDDAKGGAQYIVEPLPPMIAIPTTAGTGSEVGRSGVITMQETNLKTVIFAPSLLPNVALLDPSLTTSMPPGVTATTGMDALTHCIEAFCAIGDHPMADAIALEGILLCANSLEKAVANGNDLDARGDMMKAAMMGAVAFQKGLGACHSLAHPLSTEFGLHHGLANALCLPAVLDFNRSTIPERIARVARTLGVRGEDEATQAFECAGAIRALRARIGLQDGLAAHNIEESHLPKLAELAMNDRCHELNPRPCSVDDMLMLYKASL